MNCVSYSLLGLDTYSHFELFLLVLITGSNVGRLMWHARLKRHRNQSLESFKSFVVQEVCFCGVQMVQPLCVLFSDALVAVGFNLQVKIK